MHHTADSPKVRVDKWLWAARFFKTRSLAAEAVTGGKIEINGEAAKPAKLVHPGDEVRIRMGQFEHIVIVRDVSERRGPASVATTLYEETQESKRQRAKLAERLRDSPWGFEQGAGRPTKRDRRDLQRLRGRG
jgi:ribosome-associated heat shock protein Hsp15